MEKCTVIFLYLHVAKKKRKRKKMANLALWLRSQQPLSEQLRGLGITATASSAVFNHFQKFEREVFFFFFSKWASISPTQEPYL